MKPPTNARPGLSQSDKTRVAIVLIFLAVLLLVLGMLLGLLLRQNGFQFSFLATQTEAFPTLLIPTQDCGSPSLLLGTSTFQIQNLTLAPDGSLVLPSAAAGVAFMFETTEGNNLVVLSPTPENLALKATLKEGDTAKVTWADCSSITFGLSAPDLNPANVSTLLNQLTSGLTIFIQTDTTGNGFIVKGELTERTFP